MTRAKITLWIRELGAALAEPRDKELLNRVLPTDGLDSVPVMLLS